ncbi:MAG TPA: hypothetical protein VLU91_04625 [Nitrososphaerales archaeon]|nr:hypothetical protein [Nitrososphaerales archaeon]
MIEVVFDSSFLMSVVEKPTTWYEDIVDAIGKFQPVLLDCVGTELQKIASGQGKRSRTARVALDLASAFRRRPCGSARVDDEIISAAAGSGRLVATTDRDLSKGARAAHVRVITLSKGRVTLD